MIQQFNNTPVRVLTCNNLENKTVFVTTSLMEHVILSDSDEAMEGRSITGIKPVNLLHRLEKQP